MNQMVRGLIRWLRFYMNLLRFLILIAGSILNSHRSIWMKQRLLSLFREFVISLKDGQSFSKTTGDSEAIYQQYDDREIRDYYQASSMMLMNQEPIMMSFMEERSNHLNYVFREIDAILLRKDKAQILEIGCGNCINIFEILRKYGTRVEVHGIDIADSRIKVAQNYFKSGLDEARLSVASIAERTSFIDNQFDLVYSMFCLEQIAYDAKAALREMYRICGWRMLMLEPVFENGTIIQKLYLIVSDHTRILLKSIMELNLPLIRNEIMELQCNPSNQSTVLVVEKNAFS
jgi:ubiquinone/menaquinone biosynthesis C-methylase UbiE